MSLWTPDGERPVPRQAAAAPPAAPVGAGPDGDDLGFDISMLPAEMQAELAALPPEQQAQALEALAEMAESQRRIAETPAAEVVANHVMGFYELAAIHLQQEPPAFAEATVAIDAMRAVIDQLGPRLGDNLAVLNQALQQIQNAFVTITNSVPGD